MPTTSLPLLQNEPLSRHTTIEIGGPARFFLPVTREEELSEALAWANAEGLPVLVLGGGSNLLISDEGFPGLVIRVQLQGISAAGGQVRGAGGVDWDQFVAFTVERDLAGLECLSGIPGGVGGSPIQNIGAYGQEVKDTIRLVEAVDRTTGEPVRFTNQECRFGYRTSRFKHGAEKDRYIVTAVTFDLTPGGAPSLRYGDLTRHFEKEGVANPTLTEVREAIIRIRSSKAMVWDPLREPNSRSCGSFFTNPVVPAAQWEGTLGRLRTSGAVAEEDRIPVFGAGEGEVKLSAAWLMEKSGLKKGFGLGNSRIGLSERHVLAVINRGGGTAAEVLRLVDYVQKTVSTATGIHLEPEPVFVNLP